MPDTTPRNSSNSQAFPPHTPPILQPQQSSPVPRLSTRRTFSENGARLPPLPPLDLNDVWSPRDRPDTIDMILLDTLGHRYRIHSFMLDLYSSAWRDGAMAKPALLRRMSPSPRESLTSSSSSTSTSARMSLSITSMDDLLPTYDTGVVSSILVCFCELLYHSGGRDVNELITERTAVDLWSVFHRWNMRWAQACVRFLEKWLTDLADLVEIKEPQFQKRDNLNAETIEIVVRAIETCQNVHGPDTIAIACIRILSMNPLTESQFVRLEPTTRFRVCEVRLARFQILEQLVYATIHTNHLQATTNMM